MCCYRCLSELCAAQKAEPGRISQTWNYASLQNLFWSSSKRISHTLLQHPSWPFIDTQQPTHTSQTSISHPSSKRVPRAKRPRNAHHVKHGHIHQTRALPWVPCCKVSPPTLYQAHHLCIRNYNNQVLPSTPLVFQAQSLEAAFSCPLLK